MSSVKTATKSGHAVVTTATGSHDTAGKPTLMGDQGAAYQDSPKGAGKKKAADPSIPKIRRRLSVVGGGTMDGFHEEVSPLARRMSCVQIADSMQGYLAVSLSEKGYAPYNKKKVNQDSPVCCSATAPNGDVYSFYGALDGHGELGHKVSQHLVKKFEKRMKGFVEQGKFTPANPAAIAAAMTKELLDEEAYLNDTNRSGINTEYSGTTMTIGCVYVLDGKAHLTAINAGDSRLILGVVNEQSQVATQEVTIDHKPDLPAEQARIEAKGGRVFALEYPGVDPSTIPARVWLGDQDVPGLAMSRSLGDKCAHRAGVISDPEVFHVAIADNVRYLCVASDGLWEFMTNEEVLDMIHIKASVPVTSDDPATLSKGLKTCCDQLYQESRKRWLSEEQVVDDTTMVIACLQVLTHNAGS